MVREAREDHQKCSQKIIVVLRSMITFGAILGGISFRRRWASKVIGQTSLPKFLKTALMKYQR